MAFGERLKKKEREKNSCDKSCCGSKQLLNRLLVSRRSEASGEGGWGVRGVYNALEDSSDCLNQLWHDNRAKSSWFTPCFAALSLRNVNASEWRLLAKGQLIGPGGWEWVAGAQARAAAAYWVCLESSCCYSSAGYRLSPRHECLLQAAFCRTLQVVSQRQYAGVCCFKLSARTALKSNWLWVWAFLKKKERQREQPSLSSPLDTVNTGGEGFNLINAIGGVKRASACMREVRWGERPSSRS